EAQACHVAAWPSKADHESRLRGIGHSHHDDGDGLGGFFGGLRRRRIDGYDHLDPEPQQLLCKCCKPLISSCRIAKFDADVGSFYIAKLLKFVAKGLHQARLKFLSKYANAVKSRGRLLRVDRCERQYGHRSTQKRKKVPTSQIHLRPLPGNRILAASTSVAEGLGADKMPSAEWPSDAANRSTSEVAASPLVLPGGN